MSTIELRTPTVDLATAIYRLGDEIEADDGTVNPAIRQAADRLLELRRLLDVALPAVELFGDVKTMQAIRKELGL